MPRLRLFSVLLLLAGCRGLPAPPPEASQYACPDGRVVLAGLTPDQRLLRLTVAGHAHTLGRRDDGSYSNGYYDIRRDDLFLRLSWPGLLLPLHCHLQAAGGHRD